MRSDTQSRVDFYKRLIELRQRQANIPIADFCRKNAISIWTYYYWRKKLTCLHAEEFRPAEHAFVPVRVESRPVSAHLFEVLFPNGIVVRSVAGLDREMLTKLASIGGA
jgi:hypothetical protein